MKKMLVALMVSVLGTGAFAVDAPTMSFIGFEAGVAKMESDTSNGSFLTKDVTGQDVAYGIRIGAENEEWRASLLVDLFDNKEDNQEYKSGSILVDYFIPVSASLWWFKPYIGVHGGYMTYSSTGLTSDGVLFGAQGGFVIRLAESFNVDLGYRYSATQAPYTKRIESIQLGFNYLFKTR